MQLKQAVRYKDKFYIIETFWYGNKYYVRCIEI